MVLEQVVFLLEQAEVELDSLEVVKEVFAGPVHRTEKNRRTELNRTMVRSIFRLRLPEFGAIPVAGCRVSKIFKTVQKPVLIGCNRLNGHVFYTPL